jgi:hypothetical protein
MNRSDIIRDLQQRFANLPANFGNMALVAGAAIYQTAAPPSDDDDGGGDYPDPPANVYFGYVCSPTFPKAIGNQTITLNVNENAGNYIFDLSAGYLPEGSVIIAMPVQGLLFTISDTLCVYYSEDGSTPTLLLGSDVEPESLTITQPLGSEIDPPIFAAGGQTDAWDVADLGSIIDLGDE